MAVDIWADVNGPMPLHDEIRRLRGLLQGGSLGKMDRQLCRYLLMRAGLEAGLSGQAGWQQFAFDAALDTSLRLADDWITTPRALEVTPAARASWSYACSVRADEIDPSILRTLMDLKPVDAGPNIEDKYRVSGVTLKADGLHVQLSPTTWQLGRSFHRLIMEQPGKFLRIAGRQPLPIPLGLSRFPGLAVVHCIVVTADRQILLCQRNDTVAYDPLHWSASYEEQVTTEDLHGTDGVFQRCARRGLREEFGIDVALSHIYFLSMLLQMDNLNLGAVMLVEVDDTLEDICRLWLTEHRASHFREACAIVGIPADPGVLMELSCKDAAGTMPFHATSQLRLVRAATWLRTNRR